jgi:hypothetical protein
MGSMPHVPTFWVLGTRAPMIIPRGMVASVPSPMTHTTVTQPPAPPLMTSSKSRKLGTRMMSSWGRTPRQCSRRWPVK